MWSRNGLYLDAGLREARNQDIEQIYEGHFALAENASSISPRLAGDPARTTHRDRSAGASMSSRAARKLTVCCLVAAIPLLAWLCWPASKARVVQPQRPPSPSPFISVIQAPTAASGNPAAAFPTVPARAAAHENEVKREQALGAAWILTPITFYGKVVDEKANPVEGARVKMSAADHVYGIGSEYERQSDVRGLFSISSIHGLALLVEVSKEGYYSLPQSWGNFGYAMQAGNEQNPRTDPSAPAIFVLRKMGEVERLIVQSKYIKTSRTGTPVSVDLHTWGTYGLSSTEDFQVQTWTQDRTSSAGNRHYDWSYLITVPGGGIQQRTGDNFNFTAPEDGYQPTAKHEVSASDPTWDSTTEREYFVKLANGEYARINFAMYAGSDNFFSITSYLNPIPGHRNLEYAPAPSQTRRPGTPSPH